MTSTLGALSAFLSSLTWAIGGTAYSSLSHRYAPSVINTSRALVSLFIFSALILITSRSIGLGIFGDITQYNLFWTGVSIMSSYAVGDVLFFSSTREIGIPIAFTIASMYPLWSALFGFLFRGETLRPAQLVGLLLIFCGVAAVVMAGRKNSAAQTKAEKKGRHKLGYILAFGTSLLWALNAYAVGRGALHLNPFLAGGLRMCFASVLCPTVGFFLGQRSLHLFVKKADFKKYLWVFVLEAFGGTFFFVYAFANTSLAIASALSSLAPVLSVPIARFSMGEKISAIKFVAIVLVTIGIALLVS